MFSNKLIVGLVFLAGFTACIQYPSKQEIIRNIYTGNFTMAEEEIQLLIRDKSLSDSTKREWLDQVEIMDRILKDFSMTENEVKQSL